VAICTNSICAGMKTGGVEVLREGVRRLGRIVTGCSSGMRDHVGGDWRCGLSNRLRRPESGAVTERRERFGCSRNTRRRRLWNRDGDWWRVISASSADISSRRAGFDKRNCRIPVLPRALFDASGTNLPVSIGTRLIARGVQVHTAQLEVRTMELQPTQEQTIAAAKVEDTCPVWNPVNNRVQKQTCAQQHRGRVRIAVVVHRQRLACCNDRTLNVWMSGVQSERVQIFTASVSICAMPEQSVPLEPTIPRFFIVSICSR